MSTRTFISAFTLPMGAVTPFGPRKRLVLWAFVLLALAGGLAFILAYPVQAQESARAQAPSNLTVSLADNRVTLSWDAPSENSDAVTGYQILRRNLGNDQQKRVMPLADTGSTDTTYADSTAQAGNRYIYRVKAYRGTAKSKWSNQVKIDLPADDSDQDGAGDSGTGDSGQPEPTPAPSPTQAPEPQTDPADLAPANLTLSLGDTGILLDWDAPSEDAGNVTGYSISRSVGSGALAVLVSDTQSTGTDYTDTTATTAGETYGYQVKALRNGTESQGSNVAAASLPNPADRAPSNLTAEIADGGVSLSWDAPVDDSGSVTGYRILRGQGEEEPAVLVNDTESTGRAYTDATAATAGATYTYLVRALRDNEESASSNQARVELPEEEQTPEATPTPAPDPEALAPSNLTASLADATVSLSWEQPASSPGTVTDYEVERSHQGDDGTTTVDATATGSTGTSWQDSRILTAGETYNYRVRAVRGADHSRWSGQVQVETEEDAGEQNSEESPDTGTGDTPEDDSTPAAEQNAGDIIYIAAQQETVTEGDNIVLTVTLSRAYTRQVQATLALTYPEGTLEPEGFGVSTLHGFSIGYKRLEFEAGTTVQTITIPTAEDETAGEDHHILAYLITFASTPPGRAQPERLYVIIVEDDRKPGVPRNFRGSTGLFEKIVLSWDPPAQTAGGPPTSYEIVATDYHLHPDDYVWHDIGNVTSYTVYTTESGTSFNFAVRAVNQYGDSYFTTASGVADGLPWPPELLINEGDEKLTVHLDPSGCDFDPELVDEYQVQWKSGDQEYDSSREITVPMNLEPGQFTVAPVIISGLDNGTEYTVRAQSNNEHGSSGWTEQSALTPGVDRPQKPLPEDPVIVTE